VPCPDCGEAQPLVWQNVRWPEGRPDEAGYCCAECGSVWTDAQRWAAIRRGHWRATAEFRGRAGFHLSELYSTWRKLSETATDFLEAKGAPERLRAWTNTALGETWQERGEAPDWQRLYERREDWRQGTCPRDCLVLTAGADVQRDRVEVSVWGWGRGLRSWLVDHVVLDGDPSQPEVWAKATALLAQTWPHENGKRLGLTRLAIDTGFEAQAVYAWCRAMGRAQVMAVKGVPGGDRASPVDGPSYVEVSERGRKIRRGLQLWKVAVSVFKAETYGWLRLDRPSDEALEAGGWPAGYVHLPAGLSSEFVQQITAEQLVTVRTRQGYQRREWQKLRERNEALDTRVYARAAAWLMGLDRWDDARWSQAEQALAAEVFEAPEPPPAPSPTPRPRRQDGGGWVSVGDGWI
jgi:phage terminase large subunit GpA-like protein